MCNRTTSSPTFRDREFDSLVAESQNAAPAPAAPQAIPVLHVDGSLRSKLAAVLAAENEWAARQAADHGQQPENSLEAFGREQADASGEAGPYVTNQEDVSSQRDKARRAYVAVKTAQLKEQLTGIKVTTEQKKVFVDAVLDPFYLGEGDIDHVGLLQALEEFKGSPLTTTELQIWGTVAGAYTAQKGYEEVQRLIKIGDNAGLARLLHKVLSA